MSCLDKYWCPKETTIKNNAPDLTEMRKAASSKKHLSLHTPVQTLLGPHMHKGEAGSGIGFENRGEQNTLQSREEC